MKRFSSYLSAALAVFLMAVSVVPASAASSSSAGSSGLSIQPRKNYIINPGQTVTDKLTIGNLDSATGLTLSLRMIDFTYSNQSGTPKLDLAANAPQTPWSLKPFTTLPKSVDIPAGGTKTINYTIKIPKNQGAGSYYSAILYQAGGASGGNVALNASGVTLAFVSVPGQVKENMTLQKLGAYNSDNNGTTGSFVFIDMNEQPKMIAYTLKNEGNVFESPSGSIILKDMFGHQVADIDTNSNLSLALLGQTRLFASCIKTVQQKIKLEGGTSSDTSCVNPGLKPGRYTASLDVLYGQNGNQTHEITKTATFWYLPFWFLILVAIVLLVIVGGGYWGYRKIQAAVKGTTYKAGLGISRRKR
jgi:hypothetical protein